MASARAKNLLPGVMGKDFQVVNYRGRVYVVYSVKLPNGKRVKMSWRVADKDLKTYGIKKSNAHKIGKNQFKALNFFGNAREIERRGENRHPFQKHLKHLREIYGPKISWIQDPEFMATMLMGFMEKWSPEDLNERLKRTKWWQSRTEHQIQFERLSKKERDKEIERHGAQVGDTLDALFGPAVNWREHVSEKQLKDWTKNVASGVWGAPSEGMQYFESIARDLAEGIEGTAAWADRQQAAEEQRKFLNRPEDMREALRSDAMRWLGPRGLPDEDTLDRWATDRVSEVSSEADWMQFLRTQAQNLYPYLGPDEPWQDRASVYKRIAEEQLGTTIDWDDDVLTEIGQRNADTGEFTGQALSYGDFVRGVRRRPDWWSSDVAREEGFDLFTRLNNTFLGVG